MALNHLKIKYIFAQARDPNKDLQNSINTIAQSEFPELFYDSLLGLVHDDKDDSWTSRELKMAIDIFVKEYLDDIIDHEPKALRDLITHPESIERLKEKIYQVMR
jgi:hypothetical protein